MKKRGKTIARPAYLRKLEYLYRIGAFPWHGFTKVDVLHDDWCALLRQQGTCNCQPDVKVRYTLDGARQN